MKTKIDGMKEAIELLNGLDSETRSKLLRNIAQKDPDMAKRLNAGLFGFDDLLKLGERTMQDLIKQVPTRKLALALRKASDAVKEHFFKNMTSRAAQNLKNEIDAIGPQKLSEVMAAQDEIASLAKEKYHGQK